MEVWRVCNAFLKPLSLSSDADALGLVDCESLGMFSEEFWDRWLEDRSKSGRSESKQEEQVTGKPSVTIRGVGPCVSQ